MKLKTKSLFFVLIGLMMCSYAQAVSLTGVKITKIYVQSTNDLHASDIHAITVDKALDASCNSKLYVDEGDKEIFSTLLAYKISGTTFNILYSTGDPTKYASGHFGLNCKLFSIW